MTVTPNASHTTLSGLAAAKMNQPFIWIEETFEPGTWQFDLLFEWLVTRAHKRFLADKRGASARLQEKLEEEEALVAESLEKEKENAKFWAKLRVRKDSDMAKDFKALEAGLGRVQKACSSLTPAQKRNASLEYLKLQRQFLFLVGFSLDDKKFPRLSRKEAGSNTYKKWSPDELLLKPFFEKLRDSKFMQTLTPVPTLASKADALRVFRQGTPVPQLQELRQQEKARTEALEKEVQKELKSEKKRAPTEASEGRAETKGEGDQTEHNNNKKRKREQGPGKEREEREKGRRGRRGRRGKKLDQTGRRCLGVGRGQSRLVGPKQSLRCNCALGGR
jgi:hypothetical protein